MIKRLQVQVSGHVQGVGFRYYAVHVAQGLGLVGTVRNTADSGVEAVAEGEETALEQLLEAMRRGPHAARVDDVTVAWSSPEGQFRDFSAVS